MVSKENYCTNCGSEIQTESCHYCDYKRKELESSLGGSFSQESKFEEIPWKCSKEIHSSEILNKIEKGEPIEYNQVIIVGDIDIRNLELPKTSLKRTGPQLGMNLPEKMKVVGSQINLTNSTFLGNVNFDNSFFDNKVNFQGCTFKKDVSFRGAAFLANAYFNRVTFYGPELDGIDFSGTVFNNNVFFENSKFLEEVNFSGSMTHYIKFRKTKFSKDTYFLLTTFNGLVDFEEAAFLGKTNHFSSASFRDSALFTIAKFMGIVTFDYAEFRNEVWFTGTEFGGEFLSFEGSLFKDLYSQEHACRKAKIVMGKAGEKGAEEYHFHREMEAIRKQKGFLFSKDTCYEINEAQSLKSENLDIIRRIILYDILEFTFIQKIFGYGVHPFWLFAWWLTFVSAFTIIYFISGAVGIPGINGEINQSSNLTDYLWFSIATSATPGYALYKPLGDFKLVAGFEAILGTFMWGAFITTFSRKFSK